MVGLVEYSGDANKCRNKDVSKGSVKEQDGDESRKPNIRVGEKPKDSEPGKRYTDEEDKSPPQNAEKNAKHTEFIIH